MARRSPLASLIRGLNEIANPADVDLLALVLSAKTRIVRAHAKGLTPREVRRAKAALRALVLALRRSDATTIARLAAVPRARASRIRTR